MTRITGVAVDSETGLPIADRPVYAFVAPRDTPMEDEPINPPGGVDRSKTDADGRWELNLRRTVGNDAHYVIRVWLHSSITVDVPAGPGPYDVENIEIDLSEDPPEPPDNWVYPDYIPLSQKGAPSGVATLDLDGKLTTAQRWTVSGGGGPGGPLSYEHDQTIPSSVWLVNHDLPFRPSGVIVYDHMDERHYPTMTYVGDSSVQMQFTVDVRGVAYLS